MNVTLTITAGLPYSRRIRVRKGASVWPSASEFEVQSDLRVSEDLRSRRKLVLSPFFTKTIDGEDIVLDLKLTGSQTRTLPGGFYSIVLSDLGDADERAIEILRGQLRVRQTTRGV